MQIRVKCKCGEGKCPEWAVVELQGVVEAQPDFQDRLQNLEIGVLCRPSSQQVYTFKVGYHELTGSKVALKKPMLVLQKTKHTRTNSSNVELHVIGIIRHRILFKTRPKPLISTTNALGRCPFSLMKLKGTYSHIGCVRHFRKVNLTYGFTPSCKLYGSLLVSV